MSDKYMSGIPSHMHIHILVAVLFQVGLVFFRSIAKIN